jgi:hypothetical protein
MTKSFQNKFAWRNVGNLCARCRFILTIMFQYKRKFTLTFDAVHILFKICQKPWSEFKKLRNILCNASKHQSIFFLLSQFRLLSSVTLSTRGDHNAVPACRCFSCYFYIPGVTTTRFPHVDVSVVTFIYQGWPHRGSRTSLFHLFYVSGVTTTRLPHITVLFVTLYTRGDHNAVSAITLMFQGWPQRRSRT